MDKELKKIMIKLYKCNPQKNIPCNKKCCGYRYKEGCKHTSQWKYAKKTPLNYIKRIINLLDRRKNNE